MASYKALVVGIENYGPDYPDEQLPGCANDRIEWKQLLETRYEFTVQTLGPPDATRGGVLSALTEILEGAQAGDARVFVFAGHGTTDIVNNTAYEVLVCYPEEGKPYGHNHLSGSALANVLNRTITEPGVLITFVFDSCYAGGMTLPAPPTLAFECQSDRPNERARVWRSKRSLDFEEIETIGEFTGLTAPSPPLLIAAANVDHEARERTMSDGEDHGVFSYFATRELDNNAPRIYQSLIKDVEAEMVSDGGYDQHPMLVWNAGRLTNSFPH